MAAEQGGVLLGIARILMIDDLQPVNLDSFNRVKLNLGLVELAKKQEQTRGCGGGRQTGDVKHWLVH